MFSAWVTAPIILIGFALWILLTVFLAMRWRVIVPTNEVHTVQSRRRTVSYGKDETAGNCYYRWPSWLPLLGIRVIELPVSVFDLNLANYDAYDKGRVPFLVDILAFFRIANANMAAQRVSSFQELESQLRGILQGASRSILATQPIEEILEKRAEYGQMFTEATNVQLEAWGVVNVKNIELMDIRDTRDSHVIQNIMAIKQSTIEKQSRVAVADNMQTAQQAEILAQRNVAVSHQEAEQQVGIQTATKEQEIGIANQKAQQAIKEQEKETATRQMAVQQVNQVRQAQIQREVIVVQADQEKQKLIVVAQGTLEQNKLLAEGVRVQGEAEGAAKTAVLLAPVNAQITLAKEIGENEPYQHYLVTIKSIEKERDVGIEQAHAIQAADIKVIANAGNVVDGVSSAMSLLTSKGGTQVGGFLEALKQTPAGQQLIEAVAGQVAKKTGNGHDPADH